MKRITISVENELACAFDEIIHSRAYQNRSEAFRDLLRSHIETLQTNENLRSQYCVAVLSYIYNHHERDLSERLTEIQHLHHNLIVSVTHVHLDHEECLETMILRGLAREVNNFTNIINAERGVRFGKVNIIPVESGEHHHHHHPHF